MSDIKPEYYKAGDQDVIAFCLNHGLGFCEGNVVKYVARAGKKFEVPDGDEQAVAYARHQARMVDLKKAKEYLSRLIEAEEKEWLGYWPDPIDETSKLF